MSTYIKEIILENFLSHYYSRIPLIRGVNLITGPNGSGKSSILLGLSVALGQTYTERSRRLSDLVSRGEEIARVTLILDNSPKKGKRPFPSSNLEQVMLTRVIRKDGVYWFEFNQEVVEKNYIQRQLKRLGINPDNMLIIMHQNMIEEFAARNPVERLKLFEEAVGIAEYRKLVLSSWSKLEEIEKGSQSLIQALKNAEVNLNYWRNLYSKYERKKKLIEDLSKLKIELISSIYFNLKNEEKVINDEISFKNEEINKISIEINNLENKIKSLKNFIFEKINYKDFEPSIMIRTIEEYAELFSLKSVNDFKKSLMLNEINSLKKKLESIKEEISKVEKKHKGSFVETRRSSQEIESEIRDLQAELKTLEDISDEAPIRYKEYLDIYNDLKNKVEDIKANREKIKAEIKQRIEVWKKILTETVEKVNEIFKNILSKIEGNGHIRINNIEDLNNCSLEISVGFRGTTPVMLDSYSQSGGERTVATIAFLLASQQYMKSSIRAIDEFDIHMDPLNKERISMLLSSLSKDNPEVQYIFITPDPLLDYFKNCNVIIVAKQEGVSKIGLISQS